MNEPKKGKSIKVRKNTRKIPKENISEEGSLRIDELNLNRLLRYEAEMRASQSNLQAQHLNLMNLTKQIDPKGILAAKRNEIEMLTQELAAFKEEYSNLRKNVEKKLGVDFNKISYDNVTGVIYEDPNPEKDKKAAT